MRTNTCVRTVVVCLFVAWCMGAVGCRSTARGGSPAYSVYVTNTKKASLLPPADMDGTLDTLYAFSGQFGSYGFAAQAYVYADAQEVTFVILNEFGVDMGTLSYDGQSLSMDSAVFPQSLKPEYIMADFQNAFYAEQSLGANYAQSGLGFASRTEPDGTRVREVTSGKKVIERITSAGGVITIENFLRKYRYQLTEADE